MDDFQNVSPDVQENVEQPSEPTTDNVNEDVIDNAEQAVQETGETAEIENTNSQEEQVVFDDRQQAKVNELIGAKVAKTHEERRRAEELAAENERLKAQIPETTAPAIPELPNVNDFYGDPDGYHAKLAERDMAIQERAEFDAKQRWVEDQRRQQAQQADYEMAQRQQASIQSYAEAAQSFGIDQVQMQQDAQKVLQVGIPRELSDHIVSDPQGALITNHLARNVLELDRISQMSPMQAAVYIANEVKPKLASVKKSSTAPAPAQVTGGGGAPSKVHPSIKGAKFE